MRLRHVVGPVRPIVVATVAGLVFGAIAVTLGSRVTSQVALEPNVAVEISEDEAERILGRSLPKPRTLPAGVYLQRLVADPESDHAGASPPRQVSQFYELAGVQVADLAVLRASGLANLDSNASVVQLGGKSVTVKAKTTSYGLAVLDYIWYKDELAHSFVFRLHGGMTRELADLIVASTE